MNTLLENKIVNKIEFDEAFQLESGESLPSVTVAYETYGKLNEKGTNVILICHALTGDAHVSDYTYKNNGLASNSNQNKQKGWWDELIDTGKAFDPEKYFVICSNILGGCYGTTGPTSINPSTGKIYGAGFPIVTVRDIVNLQYKLLTAIGVNKIQAIAGGSLGGMQVLEWAIMYPEFVEKIIPIATAARHSAWCIVLNETARKAIMDDPIWKNVDYDIQPRSGLSTARMIAMISYRSFESFNKKFGREIKNNDKLTNSKLDLNFQIENYLHYQGNKLVDRFDANTYITISKAMDLHDVSRGRSSLAETLGSIKAKALCIGINSYILYPPSEQKEIASLIPNSRYYEIDSIHGHDAFLIEFDQLNRLIKNWMGEY